MEETETAILAGPLGESSVKAAPPARVAEGRGESLEQTIALATKPLLSRPSNGGLLLLVDGGGSYLILRQDRVAIGRAASESMPDIPILSDLAERHAEIARMDEDYFLFSGKDVEVGGRATRHQLLKDGDRVVFGRKGKMNFRLPSRQSSSAILELSDTTKMPNDVRRVVLFHKHALMGNHAGAHIFCRHAGTNLVLFEREGSLWLRARSDGHTDQESKMLALGQSVEMGGVRLALEPWQVRGLKLA
jgi:hypothetical protein